MSLNDFLIEKKLGDGAFSTVYSVKRLSNGERYALKKVKMGKLTEKERMSALNEIRILASINHPNVIAYKEAFFETKEDSLCIIMELADDGDLLQAIDQRKKTQRKYTEDQVWHFFIQVCRGLKALHDLKIVHRDIKCANIFLTKDGVVKLGDLNVSKVAKMGMLSTQTGTPYYASPEVWKDKPYDNRSDIWSLGCVVYEMITLLPPFRAQSMAGLATKVTKGQYESIPNKFSVDLSQMVRSLLQVEPRNRPTIDKVLANPGLVRHLT
jgi:NIMA (never in mitosis gene a)-related kinase 1/4/5